MAGEIAEALQEAHARRFLHRDLKPANIMLTQQGHVKVMDFGLAKRVEDLPSPDQATREMAAAQLTAHGTIVGTPDYMSPEQVKGVTLDARSDLFSFGVILAEMIGGRHPFRQPSTGETLAAVLREPPDLGGDIPHGLTALVSRLLAKNPEDRYASAAEVRADLARLAVVVRDASHATRPRGRRDRRVETAGMGARWRIGLALRGLPGREVRTLAPGFSRAPGAAGAHSIDCRAAARQLLGRSQPGLLR